jgi:endonuclease G
LWSFTQEQFINNTKCDQIIDKTFYTICYDYALKSPLFVGYTLQGDLVNSGNIIDRPSFRQEQGIPSIYRSSTTDYTNSGYDRGHLAPDASFDWSEESLESTYSLANVTPQNPQLNQSQWSRVEAYAREVAIAKGEVGILNLIHFAPNPPTIGTNEIAVPSGYHKILYSLDEGYQECFYYPNSDENLSSNFIEEYRVNCLEVTQEAVKNSFDILLWLPLLLSTLKP